MSVYVGIDLHSGCSYVGIVDEKDKRLVSKRLGSSLGRILEVVEPFRTRVKGVAVESTYNWYWLVDGLMDAGYEVHLANPSAMLQYSGVKHTDDESDAFFLAHLLRLGLLPEGYIYPKEDRPVRDLLRRRVKLVRQRTAHMLSFQCLITRNTGQGISGNQVRKLREGDTQRYLQEEHLILAGETSIAMIRFLTKRISVIERAVLRQTELRPEYQGLLTVPGIGKVLGLTITLETGDITRFAKVGNYSSYCRMVGSERLSVGKKKGKGNTRCGNRYLSWAYIEAAHYCRRYCPKAKSFHQRKKAQTNGIIATKALGNKLSKACYFIMKDQTEFDADKLFGSK